MNRCERCESNEVKVHLTMETTTMHLCSNCYNEFMSEGLEVELEELIETLSLKDYHGNSRTFYVERRLDPIGVFLEAVENVEHGYKFAVHGELDSNQQELLNKLIEKVRKGIGKQQIESDFFPNGQGYHSILNDQITGLIDYDETSYGLPLLIIDGKPFTWEEVGKMIMSYEGFQIKIEMHDVTDDVE